MYDASDYTVKLCIVPVMVPIIITYPLWMRWASFYLEKTSSKETIKISLFICDHNIITICMIIKIIYNWLKSVRYMLLMCPYIMSYCFLLESQAGIMNSEFQIIQDGLHFYSTWHTVCMPDQMSFPQFYINVIYSKHILWTCSHILISNG